MFSKYTELQPWKTTNFSFVVSDCIKFPQTCTNSCVYEFNATQTLSTRGFVTVATWSTYGLLTSFTFYPPIKKEDEKRKNINKIINKRKEWYKGGTKMINKQSEDYKI